MIRCVGLVANHAVEPYHQLEPAPTQVVQEDVVGTQSHAQGIFNVPEAAGQLAGVVVVFFPNHHTRSLSILPTHLLPCVSVFTSFKVCRSKPGVASLFRGDRRPGDFFLWLLLPLLLLPMVCVLS